MINRENTDAAKLATSLFLRHQPRELLGRRHATCQDRQVIQQALQIVGQLTRRGIAVLRTVGNGLEHDGLKVPGNGWIEFTQTRQVPFRDLFDELASIATVKRGSERQHFEERQAQGVNVATSIRFTTEGLWRHVGEGADNIPGAAHVVVVGQLGQTEVGNPNRPRAVQEQVAGFDIAM